MHEQYLHDDITSKKYEFLKDNRKHDRKNEMLLVLTKTGYTESNLFEYL